ncbi:MAG: restriction endonuclease subunit S, partial [Bryobacteraceae bacterium]
MAVKWRATTLGQLTDFLSGGTPSKDAPEYWGGSVPWVSAKDMKRFRLDDTEDHVTADGIANGTKLVPAGTILLLVRGMTLLNDLPICVTSRPMTFNQDVKALRPKAGVRSDFLSYLLLGNKERL